jgi:cyclopropane-fatty-acyl-phospholipid synthase
MARGRRSNLASLGRRTLCSLEDPRFAQLPVSIRFWDGSLLESAVPGAPEVVVAHRRALAHLIHEPNELGYARAWVDGSLSLEGELERVLRLRGRFRDAAPSLPDRLRLVVAALRAGGPGVLRRPPAPAVEAVAVDGEQHSIERDRTTVRHHYDVSNAFYSLVLGPSMVYSCAYFATHDDPLEQAQERKLDLICRKLRLGAGERLLDIGCGWGSLLMHAAAHYGVRGVGITLSEPQAQLARARLREAGLGDRVSVRVEDYREFRDEPFDKIASIGMYEHVGRERLDEYARTVRALLRPGGLFLNHGIARLDSEPPLGPFIARYVFPDGDLHPVTDVMASMRSAGLEVRDVESLREHYPLTLRRWVANLGDRRSEALRLVGEERVRAWELYMLGSALAFEDAELTVYQVLATRHDGPHRLPLGRAELLAVAP